MAEVLGILGAIYTSATILGGFAYQIEKWHGLSERLFDIKESLDVAELVLESWQRKYDIQDRRPVTYAHVLFGRPGWERIQQTLGSIKIVSKVIKDDCNNVVDRALRAKPKHRTISAESPGLYDQNLVKECLHRIRKNTSWSRKFHYSILGRADDLEMRLDRLHRKLIMLEQFSDYYLEKEHPDIFASIKRLPGRRVILKLAHTSIAQQQLHDAEESCKDAELLHQASGAEQTARVHIGLSVPHIRERYFAFLVNHEGNTRQILVRPITVTALNDPSRVSSDMPNALSKILTTQKKQGYILPSGSPRDAFEVMMPKRNILTDLEYKDTVAAMIRDTNAYLGQQLPTDVVPLVVSLAKGCFRLIGTRWLQFLDSKNVRWKKEDENLWTNMMAAVPGDPAMTRTLDQCWTAAQGQRNHRDLSKHVQIFRIGILLTEIILKSPVSYIEFDAATDTVKIYVEAISRDGGEVDAVEISAEVERRTNLLLGNMVYFCLSALQEKDVMGEKDIEGAYFTKVLGSASELESALAGAAH